MIQPRSNAKFYCEILNEELTLASEKPDYLIDPVSNVDYDYDGVGNRTRMIADGQTTEYSYRLSIRVYFLWWNFFLFDCSILMLFKRLTTGRRGKTSMTNIWST